jgi:hypothetical protein
MIQTLRNIPNLSHTVSESLEGEIIFEEVSNILCKMKSNNRRGSDDFSADFFKIFGNISVYLL